MTPANSAVDTNESFVSRWSRRKQEPPAVKVSEDDGLKSQAQSVSSTAISEDALPVSVSEPLELPDLASLTPQSDFKPFMQAGVATATRNAALKKLFADPQFNVMDGLDTYIGDYTQSEPIPAEWLKTMWQSRATLLNPEERATLEAKEAKEADEAAEAANIAQPSLPEAADGGDAVASDFALRIQNDQTR